MSPRRRPEPVAVTCFFECGHVVRHNDPDTARDRMEAHYGEEHADQVARLVGAISTAIERGNQQ